MSLVSVPTAGSAVLVTAPVPNPVNYNFAAGTVASSSQVNTDLYQLWNFVSTLTGQLNGLTYCPAPAISSVVVPAALTAAVGSAIAGSGTQLTLGLAHGTDFVDTSTAQTIGGTKTFSGANIHGAGNTSIAAGDASFGRSATSGAIFVGGNTSGGVLDYGVTRAAQFTATVALGVGVAPKSGMTVGDISAARSVSSGVLFLGGDTSSAVLDYGATTVGKATLSAALTVAGPLTPGGQGAQNAALYGGNGIPSISAPNGSLYLRFDGAAATRLYVNTSGASLSGTTWTAFGP